MKLNFRFSNLIGTVYRKGNIVFSADGNCILSPVGNQVAVYDLKNHKSETLPIESDWNIRIIALAPNGATALLINEGGECHYVNLISRTTIHTMHFTKSVKDAKFSPDGKYFVVCRDTDAQLFRAPDLRTMQYNPFYVERVYHIAHDSNTCLDWSTDSKFFVVGSLDTQIRICPIALYKNFIQCKLSGHSAPIVACFFVESKYDVYSIDRAGGIILWDCSVEPENLELQDPSELSEREHTNIRQIVKDYSDGERSKKGLYRKSKRYSFRDIIQDFKVKVKCAAFHRKNKLLATGFSNGVFLLHEMPDFNLIHNLSICEHPITSIALNDSGDWIGVASKAFGQLLVWEWQSETYAMKQQGHFYDMTCVAYSPDGQYMATGGQDGKVKIWTINNGFCFVTFDEHKSSITGLAWTQGGKAVISSSLDGSVRAFDLKRYRNFRTFVSPQPVQFGCVCVDASGDVVCAGGQDVFDIYVWSMQTGKILDILSGHEAPVSGVAFNSAQAVLASCSWDKSIRIWDVFESKGGREAILLNADGLSIQFSPDGKTLACLTLDCQIGLFDWREAAQVGLIECRLDLDAGKGEMDTITASKSSQSKYFSTICFSADGEYIIAGGQSRFICIYNVRQQLLVKKFPVTANLSLDNVADFVSRKKMTELGDLAVANLSGDDSDRDDYGSSKLKLPGVRVPDLGERNYKPEFRVSSIQFSPTGRSWAACTTEGLLVYSLDQSSLFNPYELEKDVTPAKVRQAIMNEEFTEAIVMAIKLNQEKVVNEAVERTSTSFVEFVCRALPIIYVEKLLNFLITGLESSKHVEFYLFWTHNLLSNHGSDLKARSGENMATLTALQQVLAKKQKEIGKICEFNRYGLDYILSVQKQGTGTNIKVEGGQEEDQEDDSDDDQLIMDTT